MESRVLTKAEMAERLFEEVGLNKREAKEIVELFFEEIKLCLESNEHVKLSGFGNFGCETRIGDLDEIRRPVKRFRSLHAGWSPFVRGKN